MAPPGQDRQRPAAPRPVPVRLPITLGQFLKAAQLASSGGEAKVLIAEGSVRVNGEVDQRRGRKLLPGDVVQAGRESALVAVAEGRAPASAASKAAADRSS